MVRGPPIWNRGLSWPTAPVRPKPLARVSRVPRKAAGELPSGSVSTLGSSPLFGFAKFG